MLSIEVYIRAILFAAYMCSLVFSLVISLVQGSKWEENNPGKLGFKWGYFFVFSMFLGNGFVLIALSIFVGEISFALFSAVVIVVLVVVVVEALQRNKWALVLVTLLSLNVFWMIINFFYLRNRWAEFEMERAEQLGPSTVRRKSEDTIAKGHMLTSGYRTKKMAGEMVKAYKGFVIIKEKTGVSVDGEAFENVLVAENWVDKQVRLLKEREAEIAKQKANEKSSQRHGSEQAGANIEDDFFVVEALKRYRRGELSEAALMEIIKSKP